MQSYPWYKYISKQITQSFTGLNEQFPLGEYIKYFKGIIIVTETFGNKIDLVQISLKGYLHSKADISEKKSFSNVFTWNIRKVEYGKIYYSISASKLACTLIWNLLFNKQFDQVCHVVQP